MVIQEALVGLECLEYAAIEAAAWPVALLSLANYLDNSWTMATNRAHKAGVALAKWLVARWNCSGTSPVTLVGYSTGGLLVYCCLKELARMSTEDGLIEAKGIVQSAFIIGAPISGQPIDWAACKSVVVDRLVNGYAPNDWLLALLHRAASATSTAGANCRRARTAGLQPVGEAEGVENVQLSSLLLNSSRLGKFQHSRCAH
eukprot:SAG31_NODE_5091_length_2748_cov_16.044923_1_plen_201_part_10